MTKKTYVFFSHFDWANILKIFEMQMSLFIFIFLSAKYINSFARYFLKARG